MKQMNPRDELLQVHARRAVHKDERSV